MPEYLTIETREWEPFDGEYAKWRVQTQFLFHRQKHVIWRYKKLHDYWTMDCPESLPIPSEDYEGNTDSIVFIDENHKHPVSRDEFYLKELQYKKHNGEWHVTNTMPKSGPGGVMVADIHNGYLLTIQFTYRLHVAEFFWVTGPSPTFHFLNNGYMKSNVLRIIDKGRYNVKKLLVQDPSSLLQDLTTRMNKNKDVLDNMIAYTTEDLKWLKMIKKRRTKASPAVSERDRLKEQISMQEARNLYLYGDKKCQFVELKYCYMEEERERFEKMAQSMDPIKEQMKPWKPFRGMTALERGLGVFDPADAPVQRVGEPLTFNSVALQIRDEKTSPFNDAQRSAMFKNSLYSMIHSFRADTLLDVKSIVGANTTDVLEKYCGKDKNVPSSALGYMSINDYAYGLFEPYISAYSLDGLVSVASIFNHRPIVLLAKEISINGSMIPYLTEMGRVIDVIRVLLWRRCKVFYISDTRYILDLEKEMNDMYALERRGDMFRFGYDSYIKNENRESVTPMEEQRKQGGKTAADRRDLYMYWSKQIAPINDSRVQSVFLAPGVKYVDLKQMQPVENASSSAILDQSCVAEPAASAHSHTVIRIVRQQRFYFDRVGYNVEITTRVEPVLLIYLNSKNKQ
jgi:hypothetical protein